MKYIAIGVVIVVAVLLIGAIVWDFLKIVAGLIIGFGLIYLGIRFMLGKGLPKGIEKVVKKAVKEGKEAADEKKEE
ncbi:MAG: hypothetical protein K8I27_13225 [Planctomycetes bacterium]|nr:hypothetical protein [Planctomycetota bacterium]